MDLLLLPLASLISGWGLLTVWRLSPTLGLKQTIWLTLGVALLIIGLNYHQDILQHLHNHKYIWLFSGLAITMLTLILGINPNGQGPNLWLGCCGVYFQPSEPLKLLLILFMAAYFADRQPFTKNLLPLLAPTIVMASIAFVILIAQRDLGTASIFVFIYSSMIYIATGKKRLLVISLLIIGVAALLGYFLFDVVQLRFEAWIDPWIDPSGRSYQIVQSLISVASGGMTGRGPGMGYPELVPIAFSDFIFSAIAEEYGLPGTIALVIAILIFTFRGFQIGLKANDRYSAYLSTGLATFLASQSILIIGGNLRLLPLTGVTLPFVSYGGSSLLTSFFALLLLMSINQNTRDSDLPERDHTPTFHMAGLLTVGFIAIALVNSWWSLWRGPDLISRVDNARRAISDRFVRRGEILDRNLVPLSYTEGQTGDFRRVYEYPEFSPLIGYTQPFFGQAGLEASLDPILRGLENQSPQLIWFSHLLYGQSPDGLDVQLTLDKKYQLLAASLLPNTPGAVVLLNASNGQILAMFSSPFYDANFLEENFEDLQANPDSPFINRAIQSLYPPGPSLAPFLIAQTDSFGDLPAHLIRLESPIETIDLPCAIPISLPATWPEVATSGCPGPLEYLGNQLGSADLQSLFKDLGFYSTPDIRANLVEAIPPSSITHPAITAFGQENILVSPLQMGLAAAVFSNEGVKPEPSLVLSAENYLGDWISYPEDDPGLKIFSSLQANRTAEVLAHPTLPIWEATAYAFTDSGEPLTWYLAGTLPGAEQNMVTVVLIERFEPKFAARIGQTLLLDAIGE